MDAAVGSKCFFWHGPGNCHCVVLSDYFKQNRLLFDQMTELIPFSVGKTKWISCTGSYSPIANLVTDLGTLFV